MRDEDLIIGITVGYMLRVMKSQKSIVKFKYEFAAIRHGDYFEFINSIKEPIPEMVVYSKDGLEVNPQLKKDDIDMIALFKSGPSLKKFFKECKREYGNIKDNDIPNSIFNKVALFEVSLRMHATNYKLLKERDNLENVINKLGIFKGLSQTDIKIIQEGRRFVNMIKHFKGQFDTWEKGIVAFQKAYDLKNKYRFKII